MSNAMIERVLEEVRALTPGEQRQVHALALSCHCHCRRVRTLPSTARLAT